MTVLFASLRSKQCTLTQTFNKNSQPFLVHLKTVLILELFYQSRLFKTKLNHSEFLFDLHPLLWVEIDGLFSDDFKIE